jgi:hypothetical protein
MSKRSFLGGTTLSSSSLIISAAASGASVHPLYQKLLSSLLTKTQQNHHHHFCRRSWYSSESKEELEKEIGYYTAGPEDCCQSSPQCKFCVWTIYDEQLAEYETNKEMYMDKLK